MSPAAACFERCPAMQIDFAAAFKFVVDEGAPRATPRLFAAPAGMPRAGSTRTAGRERQDPTAPIAARGEDVAGFAALRKKPNADWRRMMQFSTPSRCAFLRSASVAARLLSTNTALRAPRDSASNPSAPLPANKSRQRRSTTSAASQLKRVSRTRPSVGRKDALPWRFSFWPFHRPPTMRT